jgi:WD40 repeat protein
MTRVITCPNAACRRRVSLPDGDSNRRLRCPHCQTRIAADSTGDNTPPASGAPASPMGELQRVGRFEVRARLGAGAFGGVYRAHDPQLDREVALKVPHPGTLDSPARVQRFLREAKAAANLRHPNIVPLYETGRDGDRYYIASAFIPGTTLAEALAERETIDSTWAVNIARSLAEALAYAHAQGIVHRDVKPANIMLDGKGQPLLMDFGLASRKEEASKLTNEGAVLGTPSYMAPEQASGKSGAAGPAADQYSLGCLLFELLTGETPFDGPAEAQVYHHVRSEAPSPRKLNPAVAVDLAAVCLHCLEKDPAKRYPDCGALAEDLRCWLLGEPTTARPLGPVQRAARWARRNPALAAAAGMATAALLAVSALAVGFGIYRSQVAQDLLEKQEQTQAALNEAQLQRQLAEANERKAIEAARKEAQERDRAQQQLLRSESLAYANQIAAAQFAWDSGDALMAMHRLESTRLDLRNWEYRYLSTLFHKNQRTFLGHTADVRSVVFSPDGSRIASGSEDQTVKVWDVISGKTILTLAGHKGLVTSVAFSREGRQIASGSDDGTVKLWDAGTGREIFTLQGHSDQVRAVAFSPDGKRVGSGSLDNTIKLWNAVTGRELLTLKGHAGAVQAVAFSPDGKRLVSASYDKTLNIWDASTGKVLFTLQGNRPVLSVAFSPDGKWIVSGGVDCKLLWDADTAQQRGQLGGDPVPASSVAVSPDGKRIIATSSDNLLRIWDVASLKQLSTLVGHDAWARSVAFSPDGKLAASGGCDHNVKVWDLGVVSDALTISGHTLALSSLAFSPDGRRVASGSDDQRLKVWDSATGEELLNIQAHPGRVLCVAFSPDGRRIASAGSDAATVEIRDSATGQEFLSFQKHKDIVMSIAFSPDGKRIASSDRDQTLKLWDVTTGAEFLTIEHSGRVNCLAFSPDGKRIVTACDDSTLRVWDAGTGLEITALKGHKAAVESVAFSPDGKRIVSSSGDRTLRVWDADLGHEIMTLRGHTGPVRALALSPDGKRIVSAGNDRTLKVWETATGQELLTLRGRVEGIVSVAYSPDGKRIASGSLDGKLKIWGDVAPTVDTP